MKIKICIAYYSEFEACKSGIAELMACKDHEFILGTAKGSVVAHNRNALINEGKSTLKSQEPQKGVDAFLMIDSDVGFTLADVLGLIKLDKSVACLPYETASGSGFYQVGNWGKVIGDVSGQPIKTSTKGVRVVDWIGAGFHLVKRDVYAKSEFPWYRHELVSFEDHQTQSSEDIGFSINIAKAGFEMYCDFDNAVDHKRKSINKQTNNKGLGMEQPKLPSNIDSEVLALSGDLSAIAKAYKQIAQTVQLLTKENKELKEENKELKDKYEPKESTED